MPHLTEEQIAKLYPRAKTYDEIQAARKDRDEQRRPKFVALKIAFCASLAILIVTTTLYFIQQILSRMFLATGTGTGASLMILSSVCGLIILGALCLSSLYYLWSIIDGIASKTIALTALFHASLIGILCIAAAIGIFFYLQGHGIIAATLVPIVWTSTAIILTIEKARLLDSR